MTEVNFFVQTIRCIINNKTSLCYKFNLQELISLDNNGLFMESQPKLNEKSVTGRG